MGSSSSYSPLSSGRQRFRRHKRCRTVCGVLSFLSAVALSLAFAILMVYIFLTYPSHASCSINWTFNGSCTPVAKKIEHQISNWTTDVCKDGSMKCMYMLKYGNDSLIEGTHTTPKLKFIDTFNINLEEVNSTCEVVGYSSSDIWFAFLDFGTNYCNLHNLITGSGLDKSDGYTELTADGVCTQYSSSNCNIY